MEKRDVFKKLINAYPFVYRTEHLKTKYIGFAVYRDCTQDEEKMYEEYCSKLKSVSDFEHYEQLKEYDELLDVFVKVEKAVECEPRAYSSEEIGRSSSELSEGLAELPQNELEEIEAQYINFSKVRSLSIRRDIKRWTNGNKEKN